MPGTFDDAHEGNDAIDSAVADAVPDREVELLADWSSRDPNGVYLLGDGDEQFVLKFARDGDAGRIAREAATTAHAHRRAGLAPAVVAHADDPADGIPPYLVTRRLPGSTPAETWGDLDADTDPEQFRRIGAALATLHEATRREDCGRIAGESDDGGLDLAEPGSWHATLLAVTRRRVTDLEGTRFEALGEEALACIDRHPEVERGARPALVHNDPGPYNVLFEDEAVAGLVDWELAFCGDAAYDPVWVETAIREGPADLAAPGAAVESLYAGYRERLPRREGFALRRAAYRLLRALRPLRTFDSWGPAVAADRDGVAVADLADRAREAVRDRIDAVDAEGSA